MKKYIPCEVCLCIDCREGSYRDGSWFCPVLRKQICEVCCYYDSKDPTWEIEKKCQSIRCKHYKE